MSVLAPTSMSFSQLAVLNSTPINIDDSSNLQILIDECRAKLRSTAIKTSLTFVSIIALGTTSGLWLKRKPNQSSELFLFAVVIMISSWTSCCWMSYRLTKRSSLLVSAMKSLQDLLVHGPFYQSLRPFAEIEPLSLQVIENRYRIFHNEQ